MAVKKGALVLIKIGNGGMPETFATVGGLVTSHLMLNQASIDANNVESGGFNSVLSGAGLKNMKISGSGIFTDSASEETLRSRAFAGSVSNYQFIFANGNYCSGAFMVTRYERRGDYDAEEIYSLSLESAGNISYTTV